MGEFMVIGALIAFGVVLGLSIIVEAATGSDPDPSLSATVAEDAWFSRDDLNAQRAAEMAQVATESTLESPRILARRAGSSAPYRELSDDVLNRYRCFADDLARLREELAYSPIQALDGVEEACERTWRANTPSIRKTRVPIGVAFAAREMPLLLPRQRARQLPFVPSASTRV